MILYHGSNTEIDRIDLDKCRPYKDFGKGFYTTSLKDQARAMSIRTARIYGGDSWITEYSLEDTILNDRSFHIREFYVPNDEWAIFVINNRNRAFQDITSPECNTDNKYDIVRGPVANDDLVALFDLYTSGAISIAALRAEMTYRKLTNQISFHTERSISHLIKTGAYHG
ncbi:hypothetical protein FACS1894151_07300 [Spirochaetia bacterium]|nr:hypothetical protein FACS1894151_07300 [Spirochaetia bacterium]